MRKVELEQEISAAVDRIAPLVADRRTAIWIGSGLSALATDHNGKRRYPSWPSLITRLCEDCGVLLQGTSSGPENCDIADKCKAKNSESYSKTLGREFGGNPAALPRSASHILNLARPILITTNYDHVLECAARDRHLNLSWQAYDELETGPHVETPCLFYLHGRGPDDEAEAALRLVLATGEFEEAYECDHEAKKFGNAYRFLFSALSDVDVLFLGYSLDEPLVGRTLEHINAIREYNKRQTDWVMLVGRTLEPDTHDAEGREPLLTSKDEAAQIRRAKQHGIDVITYTKINGNHSQLAKILESLNEVAAAASEGQPMVATVNMAGAGPYD